MSREDPGADDGAATYPPLRRCVCDHLETVHEPVRGVRRMCRTVQCPCVEFAPASVVDRCPTCGAHFSAIEAARRTT